MRVLSLGESTSRRTRASQRFGSCADASFLPPLPLTGSTYSINLNAGAGFVSP
jgi:hypothetical protein